MGFLKKLKNIFYDEEIVEVPVQTSNKEANKPKIEEVVFPKKEVVNEIKEEPKSAPAYTERELFKTEPTFNFPIFDEDEEESKPLPKRSAVVEINRSTRNATVPQSTFKDASRSENRVFKPSPVISPIYGILDKNYKKEEIIERREINNKVAARKELSYDYVRKKAYGTLEDELETTLTSIKTEESVDDILEKVENLNRSAEDIENLLTEIEKNANVSIGEIEESIKDRNDEIEEKTESEVDNTLEHDLFNLIDSMYDDKEEDE
jgi:hypothetical protein